MQPTRKATWKHVWARRMANHTLLRMLILNFWFRLVVILFVLTVVGLVVSVPKLWQTSPPGARPVIKVSLVDLVQARILGRSARKLANAGKGHEAMNAWRAALANSPCDQRLLRSFLEHVLRAKELDRAAAVEASTTGAWLLRLTQTNRVDAGLVARVAGRFELYREVCQLLDPFRTDLSPEEETVYLQALFRTGRIGEFAARWEQSGQKLAGNPELSLYHTAYLAAWGPPGTLTESRQQLATAADDPRLRTLALQLQLLVCRKLLDVDGLAAVLEKLESQNQLQLSDRTDYWLVLKSAGRLEEAKQLADSYAERPRTPFELTRLAETYDALGLTDRAKALLKRYAPELADADTTWAWNIWSNYAALLIKERDWPELLSMALTVRTLPRVGRSLAGFSYFMEGRALHSQNKHEQAVAAFRNAARLGFPEASFGLAAGIDLLRFGLPDVAYETLKPLEKNLASDPRYWFAMTDAAHMLKRDAAVLLRVATRAYELRPDNPRAVYNYASALIINRQQPAEAAKLTLRWLGRDTNSAGVKLLHTASLAMNQRFEEADALLQSIHLSQLAVPARSFYFCAALEVHAGLGRYDLAWEALDRIKPEHLFPTQVAWVDRMRAQLPQRTGRPQRCRLRNRA